MQGARLEILGGEAAIGLDLARDPGLVPAQQIGDRLGRRARIGQPHPGRPADRDAAKQQIDQRLDMLMRGSVAQPLGR
jgi:hypothetical protein